MGINTGKEKKKERDSTAIASLQGVCVGGGDN